MITAGYIAHILVMIVIYAIACRALDLVMGEMGALSVVNGGLAGVGAYTYAILSLRGMCSPWLAFFIAGAVTGVASLIISISAIRLKSDGFVVITFAAQVILTSIAASWTSVTRGPIGISDVPPLKLGAGSLVTPEHALLLVLPLAAITYGVMDVIANRLTIGAALRFLREDIPLTESIGVATSRLRCSTFALAAAFTGLSGALLGSYTTFISPQAFDLSQSVFMITVVVVGGADGRWGPLIGSAMLLAVPETLRFVQVDTPQVAHLRQIMYGAVLVAVVFFRPRGITGQYDFDVD